MERPSIRPYRPEDCAALVELFRGAVRQAARRDYSEAQVLAWAPDSIDAARFGQRRAGKLTWVAERNGRPVGFADLEADGHIDMLYVDPACQRQGVARLLLDRIEELARAGGIDRLYAEASLTARPVFEKHGFEVIAAQTVRYNAVDFINYRMQKRLA
jgi:putative acetyltransferase